MPYNIYIYIYKKEKEINKEKERKYRLQISYNSVIFKYYCPKYVIIITKKGGCPINPGKIFEQDFSSQFPDNIWCYRIKDPAQAFNKNKKKEDGVRFSPKNEFDYLLFDGYRLFALELKSTKGTSFSFQLTNNNEMIKASQIESLTKVSKFPNFIAGLVFNFRSEEHTYFLDINKFNEFVTATDKVSINEKDIIKLNGLLIHQKIKRTRYTYDTSDLLNYKKEEYIEKD